MAAPPGIDGGPLGFLTWTIPTVAGTLAHDWVVRDPAARTAGAGTMFGWAVGLMLLGYGLSCLNRATPPNAPPDPSAVTDYLAQPPFVPPADRRGGGGAELLDHEPAGRERVLFAVRHRIRVCSSGGEPGGVRRLAAAVGLSGTARAERRWPAISFTTWWPTR